MAGEEALVNELRGELAEAKAEVAACLQFLSCELHWEWFRIEFLYGRPDDEEKKRCSEDNARKLSNFLKETRHGISVLATIDTLTKALAKMPKEEK